jgi:uncharacterized membrane protein
MASLSFIKDRLLRFALYLRGAFWAIPATLLLLAGLLALTTVSLDHYFPDIITASLLQQSDTSFDIKSILSTTGAAFLGVAGVSFSVTIASLTLASQQFGPRLIRNFIEDRFTQTVLGFFVSTFLYCMLSIQLYSLLPHNPGDIPAFTLFTTLILTVVDLLFLVLFIHHICISIQADSVIHGVYNQLLACIDSLLPDDDSSQSDQTIGDSGFNQQVEKNGYQVHALCNGYIQQIDTRSLLEYCHTHQLQAKFQHRAGDYLLSGSILASILGKTYPDQLDREINSFVATGYTRSSQQDLEYCIRQLVEVALRALSPGINDPFTAMTCIDRLGTGLSIIARRPERQALHFDAEGEPRLWIAVSSYKGLVDTAFNQIRQTATEHIDVTIRMLEIIALTIEQTTRQEQVEALFNQAQLIHAASLDPKILKHDQVAIEMRYEKIKQVLEGKYSADTN